MVEIFKTNVQEQEQASKLLDKLSEKFPSSRINFDLEDCDKILRVESDAIAAENIIELVEANGYQCCVLE
ncbi:MAG TPA: hypothetical protein VNB90_05450 [Cytophagaceae bacterium]|jgi:hypothetical protein|nr:hypothetical protein [Cytophagaceae bacterium]